MKRTGLTLVIGFIVLFSAISAYYSDGGNGELTKQEIKVLKLEEKVKKAELKVSKYQKRLEDADSIIDAGKKMQTDARIQIAFLVSEEKRFLKNQNKQLKNLRKQMKKADKDELKELYSEIKLLDKEYKAWSRNFDKKYVNANRNMEKGYLSQMKGRSKYKQYKPMLKDAQKALEFAKDNLEEYMATLD